MQCGRNPTPGFVVHGLWPQYHQGYPESCATEFDLRLPRSLIDTVLDIMPSPGLVGRQWRKHGTCTGLSPADYLHLTRLAYEAVTIPDEFAGAIGTQSVSAAAVEAAFLRSNADLSGNAIAVSCKNNLMSEVRICLNRDLSFTTCREVDRRGCRVRNLQIPSVAGY